MLCTSLILQNYIRHKQKNTEHDFIIMHKRVCVICVAVCVVYVVSMERDHLVKWWNTSQQKVIQHLDSFEHRHHSACCKTHGHVEEDWELQLPHDWQMTEDVRIGWSASLLYKQREFNVSWHSIMENLILKAHVCHILNPHTFTNTFKYTIFNVWPKSHYFLAFHLCHRA